LKYQIEYFPNPNVVVIHTQQRLIKTSILTTDYLDLSGEDARKEIEEGAINPEKLLSFVETLNGLDGMEPDISFRRYDLQINKGQVFSWEELLPHILAALGTFIANDGIIEEAGPPLRPTSEEMEEIGQPLRDEQEWEA
jgi:hypothetical protein